MSVVYSRPFYWADWYKYAYNMKNGKGPPSTGVNCAPLAGYFLGFLDTATCYQNSATRQHTFLKTIADAINAETYQWGTRHFADGVPNHYKFQQGTLQLKDLENELKRIIPKDHMIMCGLSKPETTTGRERHHFVIFANVTTELKCPQTLTYPVPDPGTGEGKDFFPYPGEPGSSDFFYPIEGVPKNAPDITKFEELYTLASTFANKAPFNSQIILIDPQNEGNYSLPIFDYLNTNFSYTNESTSYECKSNAFENILTLSVLLNSTHTDPLFNTTMTSGRKRRGNRSRKQKEKNSKKRGKKASKKVKRKSLPKNKKNKKNKKK
jgi:hypothetical protein